MRRSTRRLELTEEGQFFLARARSVLAVVEDAEEQLALRRDQPAVGGLRVNAASASFMLARAGAADRRLPRERIRRSSSELNSSDQIIDAASSSAHRRGRLRIGAARRFHAACCGRGRSAASGCGCSRVPPTPRRARPPGRRSRRSRNDSAGCSGSPAPRELLNTWPLRWSERRGVGPIEAAVSASSRAEYAAPAGAGRPGHRRCPRFHDRARPRQGWDFFVAVS
ncbi:hypothetical protein ACRAWF_28925 [Streptomyces sp. L7]